eukprot:gene16175-11569_t
MDKRARLLALNAFEQKQASRLNSSLKTRNAAMGKPDPEFIAVASGANDVARTPEQERAELEARLARFFKPHISTQIMRHRWLSAANIRDLLEVWYPVVEPHLRNLNGRRAEVRIEDIIAIFRVAVAQVPKTPAAPGVNPGAPALNAPPAGPPPPPPTGPIAPYVPPNDPYEAIRQAQHAALAEQARLDAITQRQTALRTAALADVGAAAARSAAPPSSSSSSTASAAPAAPAHPRRPRTRHPLPPDNDDDDDELTPDTTPQPASSSANLVTPAAPVAEPVTPNSRASFWTNPRALDPSRSPRSSPAPSNHRGDDAAYLQQFTGQLPEGWSSAPFDRLLARFRTSNKEEVKKALGGPALLSVVYAAYGLDRLAVVSQAEFEEHVDAWSDRGQREYLAGAGMVDVAAKLFGDTDDDDASLPTASAIEGSGMGDSFKIDRRVVRFTRDPPAVSAGCMIKTGRR